MRKLRAEHPAILRWLVEGCIEWQRGGLGMPDEVREATAQYRQREDVLAAFLNACCVRQAGANVGASKLLDAYRDYSGDQKMTQMTLAKLLTDQGFYNDRFTAGPNKGRMGWFGIGLLSEAE